MMIPNQIQSFLLYMNDQGFQAYLVGGCVRDGLMHLIPHDWDVCTDALPQELQELFPDSLSYGIRHGTVTVKWQKQPIEVTTFRTESAYSDHRRPDHVSFVKELNTDLARRDFTVNAMAMDAAEILHDPFGGLRDLEAGTIRAVGSAELRFREDALRMLRAIRFSAQLGFSIESSTKAGIQKCALLTSALSAERVAQEIEKTLLTEHPEHVSDMIAAGLLIPWIKNTIQDQPDKMKSLKRNRIHRWCGFGLLLQDTAFLNNLRLDRKTIMICGTCIHIRESENRDAIFWKQAVHQYGTEAAIVSAEVLSAWDSTEDEQILHRIQSNGECCSVSELAVTGNDLKGLGYQGKEIGTALNAALQYVWRYPEQNVRESLLNYLQEEIHHG